MFKSIFTLFILFQTLYLVHSVHTQPNPQNSPQPEDLHLARRKITRRKVSNGGTRIMKSSVSINTGKKLINYIINGDFELPQVQTKKITIVESWGDALNNDLIEIAKGSLYNSRWTSGQVIVFRNSNVTQTIKLLKGKYKIVFDYANGQKSSLQQHRFSVYWNNKLIKTFNYQDYEIHHQELIVDAIDGINVLQFRGEETSDSAIHTIDNVGVYRVQYRSAGRRVVRRAASVPRRRIQRRRTRIVEQQDQPEEDYVLVQRAVRKRKPKYVQVQIPQEQQEQYQQIQQVQQQEEEPIQVQPPKVTTTAIIPPQQTIQKIVYKKVQVPVQKIVERIVQVPVEKVVQKIVKKIIQVPVEKVEEKIVQVPVQKIVQRIKEVQKKVQVPVEKVVIKVVYQPVNKTVQKIVQRIEQVPVDTIVQEKVEVPVYRIVKKIVQKKVQVPVQKQKIIQVPVPVEPVYKTIRVPLQVNVPVSIEVPMRFQIEVQVPDNEQVIVPEDIISMIESSTENETGVPVQFGEDFIPQSQHTVLINNVTFNASRKNYGAQRISNKLSYRYLNSPDTLTIRRKFNKFGIIKNIRRINSVQGNQTHILNGQNTLNDTSPIVIKLSNNKWIGQSDIPHLVNITTVQSTNSTADIPHVVNTTNPQSTNQAVYLTDSTIQ